MKKHKIALAQSLLRQNFITERQFSAIEDFHHKDFFSVRTELLSLMYIAVLMIASASGVLIYQNIDSVGHMVLIALIGVAAAICIYISFKRSRSFSYVQTSFENPIYDYLVLLGTLLTCSLIGYLQFQYNAFGQNLSLATLIASIVSFGLAYYFDNRASLSIAVTSLAAFVGITITPKAVIENNVYLDESLTFYGLALSVILLLAAYFSVEKSIKSHFSIIYVSFAMHLAGICAIIGMFEPAWIIVILIFATISWVNNKFSYQLKSVTIFAFNIIYSGIILTIALTKLFEHAPEILMFLLIYATPVYFAGLIYVLTISILKFKKQL